MTGDHLVSFNFTIVLTGFSYQLCECLSNTFCFPLLKAPSYPKSSFKREYVRHEELPSPRSRPAVDYGPRSVPERRPSYREDYSSHGTSYSDLPRSTSRTSARRAYADDGYNQRYERPPPSYQEGRSRDYDSVAGSKRPYSAIVSFNAGLMHCDDAIFRSSTPFIIRLTKVLFMFYTIQG